MQYCLLAVVLIGAATLGGCTEGVLDPKGPVAAAERLILFNSLGIMLAIVIPTILATLGVAWWFRSSNKHARYLPNFDYSGRLEMLVWSIPIMTVLLVGGVAWVGSSLGGSRSRDTYLTCGASGSRPSTISASGSCISCWRCSCCCAALPMRS
jgi:heme/copper-type cytochrome/quinol oxidase subunit 2